MHVKRFFSRAYSCSSSYLGGHVVGVMNHSRTAEVFMEVIYIFTHSAIKRTQLLQITELRVVTEMICSYRLLRLPDTQM